MRDRLMLARIERRLLSQRIVPTLLMVMLISFSPSVADGAGMELGTPLPEFSAKDLAGKTVKSTDYRGKVLLIDFWAITCSACLEEMPHLVDIYNRYREQGLEAIGVNTDRSEKRVKSFVKKLPYEMTYTNVIDAKTSIMRLLKVQMLPTTLLVDRTGVIRLYHVGYSAGYEKELEEEVKKLLAEP